MLSLGECDLAVCADVLSEVEGVVMRSSPEPHLTLRVRKGERILSAAVRIARAFEAHAAQSTT